MTGVLQWRDMGSLERSGRGACPLCERAAGVHEAVPGDERRWRAYGLGLKRGQAKVMTL